MKESPEYLRMSLAAAITLGFRSGRFYRGAKLDCINLLLTYARGCLANCAYCGLARKRIGEHHKKSFIRVKWPIHSLKEILGSIKERKDRIKRICVSMITNPRAPEDVLTITERIKKEINIPISLLIAPTVTKERDLKRFKGSGADMVGVAVDAATPEIFESLRGRQVGGPHKWEKYWLTLERAIEVFGAGKVGCHLIVGLGETEEEMLATIQKVRNLGARTHLFSFFPEPGSKLEDHPQPPVGQYRRVQLGRFLIDEGIANFDEFSFDDSGRLLDFGLPDDELSEIIESGRPFMTSGCPGEDGKLACNRPYGDSPPGPDIRSYPFLPEEEDIGRIKEQLWS